MFTDSSRLLAEYDALEGAGIASHYEDGKTLLSSLEIYFPITLRYVKRRKGEMGNYL